MKEGFTSKEVAGSAQTVWSSSECEDIHAQAGLLDKWNQSYSQLSSGAFGGDVRYPLSLCVLDRNLA